VISLTQWSTGLLVGQAGFASLAVTGPQPVVVLDLDLLGDGQASPTHVVGTDLRLVRQVAFTPTRVGTFGLVARVVDDAGCTASTVGQVRNVVVR